MSGGDRAARTAAGGVRPQRWRTASLVLWPPAVGTLLHLLVESATGRAGDLRILWRSAASLASGGPLYDPGHEYLYPPVSGWVLAPLGLLPFRVASTLVAAASVAAVVLSVLLLLRTTAGVRLRTPRGSAIAAGTLLLVALSRPVTGLLRLGNVDLLLLLVLTVAIVLLGRGRDVPAGVLLGTACAVKPVLLPALVALLLLGRARALAGGGAALVVLTAVGFLTVPDASVFTRDVLPLLAAGNRVELAPYDRSVDGAVDQLGLPAPVGLALRAAVLATACWLAWRCRGRPRAAAEALPIVLVGSFAASSFAWADYGAYLLPLLLTVGHPDSLVRAWPAWAGVYLAATTDAWHVQQLPQVPDTLLRLVPLWGWLLVLGTCVVRELRGRRDARGRPAP
ncbi:glycosyltransferase 87 family protein [Kineococcus arenarius]|uniref:glycosyltransferase 87 family protein n=1 Tax=Kineococcus sp. SYSU DK007 TaxID=3383128 RepID=UPI003D7C4793